ncbi:phage head morphogenesis protein [Treponema pectinovorum]|uniref:phage head morphogenesis protein n=1 Tax=Treponema pectinovorum TaxID=164 RepID=UPI0011CC0AFE|nr:phage minor head protein [Treponema pectinovorum]
MADKLIPKQALEYIKNKKLRPAFSYKDVWNEEHATAFTVAKAMQLDVLSDIKGAVEKAIENGTTFEQFKKEIKPTLMKKGWWGRKEMTDPLTGRTVDAQLGSDRRLKTIYSTNLRSAYQKGQYDRTMESDLHPYLMYKLGASTNHREAHVRWNNLILTKDDPLWNSIMPPNGYGCKCYTVAVTQARKEKYESEGVPDYNPDTQKTVRVPVQTTAPKPEYRNFFNERKGTLERIPKGITPGFNWNQGQTGRLIPVLEECIKKFQNEMPEAVDSVIKTLQNSTIYREQLSDFVDEAYKNKAAKRINNKNTTPVGFLDRKLTEFLKTQGIEANGRSIIVLEQRLITGDKYLIRHAKAGNAPSKQDWKNIMDYIVDADVYWDNRNGKKNLLFLKKLNESKYIKIAVDVLSTERYLKLPKVDTMFYLKIETEDDLGISEYREIIDLKKIR